MELKNKIALITGAASGLGAATARELASKGAKVVLLDRTIDAAAQLAEELNGTAFECDVTSEISIQKALDTQENIHIVVNCAGVIHGSRIVGKTGVMPLDDFSRVIQINLIGTFNVMRLCSAKMAAQQPVNDIGERGVIINTASVAAYEGQIGQAAYSASKGGVVSMTLPAARELARFGIRVMSIAPGVMHTPMVAGMTAEVRDALSADVPFPKQLGDPKQFAMLCAHIVENTYLNGGTIRLDGALRMQ